MNDPRHTLRGIFPEVDRLPADCFIVGGTVRDLLCGVEPVDVDVALDRARERAAEFARRTNGRFVELGGERFPTYRVAVEGRVYDFTDIIGKSIDEDLGRRDFTINSIAIAPDGSLLDPHGGQRDLDAGLIRMIREENLVEDPLRMLKAVRMAVQLDFEVENETERAIRRHAPELSRAAAERVTYELNLVLANFDRPYGLGLLRAMELDRVIFGRPASDESLEAIARIEDDDRVVAYSVLLSSDDVDAHADRWKWSEEDRLGVHRLHRLAGGRGELAIRLYDAGREASFRLPRFLRALGRDEEAEEVERVLRERGDEIFDLVPLLSGDEIQRILSIPPGKDVGRIKRELIEAQLRRDVVDRTSAEKFVRSM